MLDFLRICKRYPKRNEVDIYPDFQVLTPSNKPVKDLMIKGNTFYAVWDEELNLWSTDPYRAIALIDRELAKYAEEHKNDDNDCVVKISYLKYSSTGSIDRWNKFVTKQCPDNWHQLDSRLIFSNEEIKRSDYASKQLDYPLEPMDTPNYTALTSVLYSPEELHKIEWAIGSIVTGNSRKLQKFEVLYGSAGTGKGTILDIISRLFKGYCCTFEAKALGSANAQFALEPFKNNPLVAIQFDGDLSKIEDNTRLNSLVSHEEMTVNEKHKSMYANSFHCFLFMGTNKPVKITDAKSGLIRRLIDVSPTGNKVSVSQYNKAMEAINFELPGIAWHCKEVYEEDPNYYQNYIPVNMLGASNDFYNFVEDSYDIFKAEDSVTLKAAWEMYKTYCEDAKVGFPYSKRAFKEELKNYFDTFEERTRIDDLSVYNLYSGFKFHLGGENEKKELKKLAKSGEWLNLDKTESLFDIYCKDYPAQYSNADGIPSKKWVNCVTKLSDLNTSKEHYVKLPEKIITIDFDYKDKAGNKDRERNLEEASKWPPTYAEFSKSGAGVHLHYLYSGDVTKLANRFNDDVEIKVASGNSSLRRRLTYCNNLPIAEITSGLPLKKGDKHVINFDGSIKDDKDIINRIKKIINGEYEGVPGTKSGVDLIKRILDEAYESGIKYDVSLMRDAVLAYAAGSTNHAQECIKTVGLMKFKSQEILDDEIELYEKPAEPEDPSLVFFDVEVFPNLFLINWKTQGKGNPVIRMINPTPKEVEALMRRNLVGFNCRRYDNHMLFARMMGYSEEQLFRLSQRIVVNQDRDAFFSEAYDVSYTDIYDYSSKKQSLKKWEIELGIKHMELNLPWDQPVPKEKWMEVAEYCDNDVISTEAVFDATQADFLAREILADLAGGTVNDTTNTLTTRLIFGNNKKPQSEFNYRFLGEKPKKPCFTWKDVMPYATGESEYKPEGQVWFDGYSFEDGKSTYRGYNVGEGGRVYANPGSYGHAKTFDVASMHPHSITAENLFGDEYTDNYKELMDTRVDIKHKDFDYASKRFGGKLAKYLTDPTVAKNLAQALKIAINSVYGLTSAKFVNAFRDPRNVDNIVAKRGALFMIDLQLAVESLGYTVIHIKTDSIKIHEPDEFIEKFVLRFGECYGYSFELEDEWDRICLVNDAVFIGHTEEGWQATGAEFQVPYVFKSLFTHEDIIFDDLCETKSVSKGAIYIDMEDGEPMRFVGRVGQFCPVKHGGVLYRVDNGRNFAVAGTKGYRWLESSMVKNLGKEDDIDISYYENLAHEAMLDISQYCNFEAFVNTDKPFVKEDTPVLKEAEVPLELPFK